MSEQTKTEKRFSWKIYGLVLLLVGLGALAKVPAAIFVEQLLEKPEVWLKVTGILFTQDFLIMGLIPAGVGLLVIKRTGFRLPFIESVVSNKSAEFKFGKIFKEALFVWAY